MDNLTSIYEIFVFNGKTVSSNTVLTAIKISFFDILVEFLCKFNFTSIHSKAKSRGRLSNKETTSGNINE